MPASGWSTNGGASARGATLVKVVVLFACTLAVTTVACYDPTIGEGHLECTDGQCPSGLHCAMACNRCYHGTFPQQLECTVYDAVDGGTAGGSGQGEGGSRAGGAGGGGGMSGADGGSVVGGVGANGAGGIGGTTGGLGGTIG